MKTTLSILIVALTFQLSHAQNNTITASVQDESGKLLHYVYVGDGKYKNAAFTDSVGDFTITTHADSRLLFKLDGYRDTVVQASSISQGSQIILNQVVKLPIETTALSLHTTVSTGGLVVLAHQRANVAGSRYMFDAFARGFFTDMSGKQVYDPNCLFNYEKMSGFLLLTRDKQNVREVDRDQVKSFTVYDKTDQRFDFEQVPDIDKIHYLQVLAAGTRYKIYKLVHTQYIASDVAHTASGDRGQDYDQYVDDSEYYVVDVQTGKVQKFALKKRAIKEAFLKETGKVEKFMSQNAENVDEAYLKKLGSFLNS